MYKRYHKTPQNNQVGLLIQVVLMFFVLVYSIITAYELAFLIVTEILLAILMFVMAYNNQKTFKRKGMTYVYLIVGSLIVLMSIGELLK